MAVQLVKVLKWTVGGIAIGGPVGGSLAYLHANDWDIQSSGLVRFGRAAVVVMDIVVDYKRSLASTAREQYRETISEVHWRCAEKLRKLCCINRGVFIKVGQHLGALEFLLPMEYVKIMQTLHSDAPQSDFTEVCQVIKEDMGKDVDEIFSSFDEKPIGTASLAQVHRATLKDGTLVAVKVQHPRVKAHSFIDMKTMELLVQLVARIFPEFKFSWLAEETKKNLPLELDFVHEAHNCERVGRMFKHFSFLKIPKIHWDFTTERVLTMEYCDGGQVNDKEYVTKHNICPEDVTRKLGLLYSEMIFEQGYVHCDPHPGNVLVKKVDDGTQIVLLDHGLYLDLTDEVRLNYTKFWTSLIDTNLEKVKKYAHRLNIGRMYPLFACMVTARSWESITKGISKQKVTQAEEELIKQDVSKYLPEISDILNTMPRQLLLIFKTNDLLRGIETSLKTRSNATSFITMSRCCIRAVHSHRQKRCTTWWCHLSISFQLQVALFKLSVYEFYLWLRSSKFGQWASRLSVAS